MTVELPQYQGPPKVRADAARNRATILVTAERVVGERGGVITLGYKLFPPGDKPSKPTGALVKVRFTMADGRLVPQDPIPPVASRLPS